MLQAHLSVTIDSIASKCYWWNNLLHISERLCQTQKDIGSKLNASSTSGPHLLYYWQYTKLLGHFIHHFTILCFIKGWVGYGRTISTWCVSGMRKYNSGIWYRGFTSTTFSMSGSRGNTSADCIILHLNIFLINSMPSTFKCKLTNDTSKIVKLVEKKKKKTKT